MHVVERGTGIPLVIIHGFGADHRLMLSLDRDIEASGEWRRIYVDLPGHGQTPIGDVASSDDVALALHDEIVDRLGQTPFAVLGSSFGGMMARRVAHDLRSQVLGLGLLAPVIIAEHVRRRLAPKHVHVENPAVVASLGAAAESYTQMTVVQSEASAAAFLEFAQPGIEAADEAAVQLIAQHYSFAIEPEVASPAPFVQPTLFLTGRHDNVVGFEDAWDLLPHYPHATFITLDAAGHNPQFDQPEAVGFLLRHWLGRVAETARP